MGILDYLFMVNGEMSALKVSSIGLALFACILMFATWRLNKERNRLEDDIFRHTQKIESVQTTLVQKTTITLDNLFDISKCISENKDIPVERLILEVLTSRFEFKSNFVDEACRVVEDAKKDEKRIGVELEKIEGELDKTKSYTKNLEQRREDLRVYIRENQYKQERAKEIVKQFD